MDATEWLRNRRTGFDELSREEIEQISQFSLLWTYFEAKTLGTMATAGRIITLSENLFSSGATNFDEVAEAMQHFRERYIDDGSVNYHFGELHFRRNDREDLVTEVLLGRSDSAPEHLAAALLIVFRLRNNLFHGLKWAYALRGQRENFRVSTKLMMKMCELHEHFIGESEYH
ncbi:hypothetical protein [Burkholderia gladioli]|uniref:hypothetical protein n=1 Tax=Burkholderia gladioli TaxID=28095 RepID=UPI00163FF9EC|nr:hypothetical protein [Burkholderia gladioli]